MNWFTYKQIEKHVPGDYLVAHENMNGEYVYSRVVNYEFILKNFDYLKDSLFFGPIPKID